MRDYFIFESANVSFTAKEGDFITFIGGMNKEIVDNLLLKKKSSDITINYSKISGKTINKLIDNIGYVVIDFLDTFLSETVMDELAFNLESKAMNKKEMKEKVKEISEMFNFKSSLLTSPLLMNRSEKVKLCFARAIISNPKIIVIDNMLDLLDKEDFKIVSKILNEYVSNGNIVLNFTSNIEEALLGNTLIVSDNEKIAIKGNTLSVLNEEKLMKRLGIGLPFIVLLNKYLKDYELLDNYILSSKGVSENIWK